MTKLLLVARRELLYNIRRPAFLFASFGVPLLTIGLMVVIFAVAFQSETDTGRVGAVGYVDHADILDDARDQPETFLPYPDETAARASLDSGEIGAYFVLPDDYLHTGSVRLYSSGSTPEALQDDIDQFLLANLGAQLGDEAVVARIQSPVELTVRTLDNNRALQETAMIGLILMPLMLVFVMMMAMQITSGYLMSGVVEEKTNRIMEILLTSVTPFQMLMGKIIGLGALGLIQLVVWLGVGAVTLRVGQGSEILSGVTLPPDMVAVALVYFLLSYLLMSSLMAGVGAVVGSEQESRQFAGFFSFGMVIPFFFMVQMITDPNGTIPTILTFIPFTAPTTVVLRMGFGAVPAWQLAVSMLILLLTTLIVVWASARVFRWSLLMVGKRPGLRDILRAVRRAPEMAVEQTS